MSGIYIPGMEMPTSCARCRCVRGCPAVNARIAEMDEHPWFPRDHRHPDCPLIPVPPHGRLIDAKYVRDAIIQEWMDKANDSHMYKRGMEDAYEVIRNAPTIIPAEDASDG